MSRWRGPAEAERERCFIEDNVAGYDDPVGGEVEAPVALVIRGVPQKHAQRGAGGKFVGCGGGEVGVAGAPEGPEIMVRRESAIEGEEWGAHVESFGGEAVDEVGGGGESIGPVGWGHRCLEE